MDTAAVDRDALLASYREALEHSNALTDRISTDQFSAHYDDPPPWAIGPANGPRNEPVTPRA